MKSSMVVFPSDIFRGRPFQQSNRIGFGTGESVYMFKASVVVKARKTIQKIKTNLHTTVQRQFEFFYNKLEFSDLTDFLPEFPKIVFSYRYVNIGNFIGENFDDVKQCENGLKIGRFDFRVHLVSRHGSA